MNILLLSQFFSTTKGGGEYVFKTIAKILVQNSRDVEVFGNMIEVPATYGNGIGIVQQKRGDGEYGPRISINNNIHDNRIIYLGTRGRSGMAADYDPAIFKREGNNRFDSNTYVVPHDIRSYIEVEGELRPWDEVQKRGYEINGRVDIDSRLPLALSCD